MSIECGPVHTEKRPGLRGYSQEKFTSLVQDETGSRWVTTGAIVSRRGDGPEKIAQMTGWTEAAHK